MVQKHSQVITALLLTNTSKLETKAGSRTKKKKSNTMSRGGFRGGRGGGGFRGGRGGGGGGGGRGDWNQGPPDSVVGM